MATGFTTYIDPDSGAGHHYDILYDWEAGEQCVLTTCKVLSHGGITGTLAAGDAVTGENSSATATIESITTTQILLNSITGTFQTAEQIYKTHDAHFVTSSSAPDNAIMVATNRCTGGTADTTGFTIDGWTPSATQYIKIWTDPAESYGHEGVWSDTKARMSTGASTAITVVEDYTKICWLQFTVTGGCDTIVGGASNYVEIFGNISKSVNSTGSEFVYSSSNYCNFWKIYNNIIYDHANAGIYTANSGGVAWSIFNNTCHNCNKGMRSEASNALYYDEAKNNLLKSCTTAIFGTYKAGSGYNATDNASMGYTVVDGAIGDHVSHTFTFVNEGADDFHLASNDAGAIGFGVTDPGSGLFSDDIDGQTRSGSWDIGADEYMAAVSAISISISETLNLAEALD